MLFNKIALATVVAASLIVPIAANAGEVRNREVRQENRIYNGVKTGELTQREYDALQRREAQINEQRLNDLHRNDGHLTAREYRQLNREENRLSKRIYNTKHDRNGHP